MENLLRLTAEQFDRLDELEENDRCLLTGATGTGGGATAALSVPGGTGHPVPPGRE